MKLTNAQKELADLLIATKTHAKVRRRKKKEDGSYEFYYLIRDTSPIDFKISEEEFAFVHHEKNPEAPLSPVIVNLRNLPENLVEKIAQVLAKVKLKTKPLLCTGIPNAAIPFAKKFSEITKIPYVTIFEKDDVPGRPRVLPASDAPKGENKKIIIIDDLITKGNSKIRAIKVAEELGYKVIGLLVLVDREQGGKEMLNQAGYELYTSLSLTDLLQYYLKNKKITKEQFDETIKYLKEDV